MNDAGQREFFNLCMQDQDDTYVSVSEPQINFDTISNLEN